MADENKEIETTKEKRTVPALVRTPRGVADHATAVYEMQWDKERKSFKDPVTVMVALFAYAKLTPALLDEAVASANARATALEVRVEKLETQLAAFESWREEAERQGAEMAKGFAEMISGGDPMAKLKKMIDAPAVATLSQPPTLVPPAPIIDATVEDVVPLKAINKTVKTPVKTDGATKNGGAA